MPPSAPKPPFESPVVPHILGPESRIRFKCFQGIACYNQCCRQADVTLTPYDVLVMKNYLGISSGEFVKTHTVPFEMDADGLPGIKLRTGDEQPVCQFMRDAGCSIYPARPAACRYYPVGLLARHVAGSNGDELNYCLVREDHCIGHDQEREQTLSEYREEQGLVDYDEMNREWYRIILKKRSAGPVVGKPPSMSLQLFFMASYDLDRFRQFVSVPGFRAAYALDESEWRQLEQDDAALLRFGYRLMGQVFFNEQTIDMVEGAVEKRSRERAQAMQQRRELEIALWREKQQQAEGQVEGTQ